MGKKIIKIVTEVLVLIILLILPHPAKASGLFEMPQYTFHTIMDTDINVSGMGHKATVLIFGKTACSNTDDILADIAKSSWGNASDIQVVFASTNGSKEDVQKIVDKCDAGSFISCYSRDGEIFNAMIDLLKKHHNAVSASGSMSTVMPMIVLVDENNMVQTFINDNLKSADDLITMINKFADTRYTTSDPYYGKTTALTISGTEDYVSANQVYEMVNHSRNANGMPSLRLDKELTETAMQRAAELAVYYSHIRPDGTKCFKIFPSGSKDSAENIAIGYSDADRVMDGWLNSSGHYDNIMRESAVNIGVGSFIDRDGTRYWVQCFDNREDYTATEIRNRDVTRKIAAKSLVIDLILSNTTQTYYLCSETAGTMQMVIKNINGNYSYRRTVIEPCSFVYTSDQPEVASVDDSGKVTLHGEGIAVITATLKGDIPCSVSWTIGTKSHEITETSTKKWCRSCGTVLWEKEEKSGKDDTGKDDAEKDDTGKDDTGNDDTGNSNTEKDNTGKNETENKVIEVKPESVFLSKTSLTYNGKMQQPTVTARDSRGNQLSSANYTVTYSNNKNVGQATVTVIFKNGYSGTIRKTFLIKPKGATFVRLTARKKGFIVCWKKQKSQISGYEIQYSRNKKFKSAKIIKNIKSNTTSKETTKLKAGKKYYVRIRTYKTSKINGKYKKLYSGWSKMKSVVTKK